MATVAAPAKAAAKRSIWWRIHAWAGLKLSLILTVILFTGTLATISNEIDWLLRPPMRASDTRTTPPSFGAVLLAARSTLGEHDQIERLLLPGEAWQNPRAVVRGDGNRRWFVYVERSTGEVAGIGSWMSAQRILRDLHRRLFIPTEWGIRIVSSLSLLLLASLVSGLVTYKRFWWGFFKQPRTRPGTRLAYDRRFMGDLHRLLGLWTLPLLMLMVLTGLWYLVEASGGAAPRPVAEKHARAALEEATELALVTPAIVDTMVEEARDRIPSLRVREVRLPMRATDPIVVMGQADAVLVRDRANAVWFDPGTGMVIATLRGEELNAHQRIGEAADPLHFGTFGGIATKLLYFALGLGLTLLAVSGAMVYALRLAADDRQQVPKLVWNSWSGMGGWRYLSLGLLMTAGILAPFWLTGAI